VSRFEEASPSVPRTILSATLLYPLLQLTYIRLRIVFGCPTHIHLSIGRFFGSFTAVPDPLSAWNVFPRSRISTSTLAGFSICIIPDFSYQYVPEFDTKELQPASPLPSNVRAP